MARTARPAAKADAYQDITNQVIEMLEAGTAPWRKPWDPEVGMPRSLSTGKIYRGVNTFLLAMTAQAKGYISPWWGTYKQITERGGQVRKGEKSTKIVFWKILVKTDPDNPSKTKHIPLLRVFSVFNVEQADGLTVPELPTRTEHDRIAACDAAVHAYLATGPSLRVGGDTAYYQQSLDLVAMPELETFGSAEGYYGALFHELSHSTGHESRLNREGIVEGHRFGDELYSKEELIAEMGAAFLAGHTGIVATTLANSASYLQSWINVLREDAKLIVSAAQQAQKAVEMILGEAWGVQVEDEEDAAPVALAV